MRLIDADAMLERLQEWNTADNMDKALYNFTFMRIMEQPTIYDVDMCIEAIEGCEHIMVDESIMIEMNDAINVVKDGGINDI